MGDNYYQRDIILLSTRQKSIINMNKINYYISSIIKASHAALLIVAIGLVGFAMQSCDNDNDEFPVFPLNRPNALVTLKPTADGSSFYMQLDDSTKINATNIKQAPYGNKEVRAFINFRLLTQPDNKRNYDVYVNWLDSILTKPMIEGGENAAELISKGQDPVEILREWTVSEDGYLTIDDGGERTNIPMQSEDGHYVNSWEGDPAVDFVFLDNLTCYDMIGEQWYMSAIYDEALASLTASPFYCEAGDQWSFTFYDDGTYSLDFDGEITEGQWWFNDACTICFMDDYGEAWIEVYYDDISWEIVALEYVSEMYYPG